jgi:hypothetical protein
MTAWDQTGGLGGLGVPRVGTRIAEPMEIPIMLVVTIVTARLLVLRLAVPSKPSARLGNGCITLALRTSHSVAPKLSATS